MPISKPHSTLGAENTGSCSSLANYLDKENRELELLINKENSLKEINQFQNRKQDFFNHNRTDIGLVEVIDSIDNNRRKLGKKDAKYYAPTISFSQAELNHLVSLATDKKEVTDVWQLNSEELKKYNDILKIYIKKVMDNYAENFNRQSKGLHTGQGLVYYAKIEHFRKFKGTDPEVVEGVFKNGDYKPGLNSHAHVIVSRKDKTQLLKLDPTTKERSTQRSIGGNAYQVGFDRTKWTEKNEKAFDLLFNYRRPEREKFRNQNILKNGSPRERDVVNRKIKGQAIKIENEIKKEKTQLSKGFKR
ncbi:DUF5712 family protein [Leeuwenhoekiella marinoflava]|uniref:Mobilization protein n=2 Tax=Leeuwenhoekiella marinoflava TaxID=988 RepID=A0A4Q0PM12_9FLAO|nr:DUF5712 family protein [Leeuwenhoekiella marinoflava]RXG30684.1 hypothetical protein DSL99_1726 [Leeuwenhoekiella marinoflava]SHF19733.1 hypothetical protein SAMN02745246_01931 [Leeuwenhoekiella marinoflava DSM 3653]